MTEFTTRIIKGGALLAETRRLLEVWDDVSPVESNLDRIRTLNLLGLPSRARAEDTLQILRQRFIDPDTPLLQSLRFLSRDSSAFREACYYEATRNDDLLAFAAENVLYDWWELGRNSVSTEQLERALVDTTPDPKLKAWRDSTRRRALLQPRHRPRVFRPRSDCRCRTRHTTRSSHRARGPASGRPADTGRSG